MKLRCNFSHTHALDTLTQEVEKEVIQQAMFNEHLPVYERNILHEEAPTVVWFQKISFTFIRF